MQIQLIGHASVLVTTTDCRFLVDPVFFDPHGEGIEEIYPRRHVIVQELPEIDLVIISHRHFDHFDIQTLARLPKHLPVLIPEDRLMRDCLELLGYANVRAVASFKEIQLGQTRVLTTGSAATVQEFGLLFADSSGVFWNQIDSVAGPKTIQSILARYGAVDLMLAMWQPMLEFNYQMNRSLEFPYSAYGDLLSGISLLSPGALAPGANGFRYHGASSWLDGIVFPVTRERFCNDVVDACPSLHDRVFTMDPGDMLTIKDGRTRREADTADFLQRPDRTYEPYRFTPVVIDGHFIDRNPDGYDAEKMSVAILHEIQTALPAFIRSEPALFASYRAWNVIFQIEIAFPDRTPIWTIDFSREDIEAVPGASPMANVFSYVTASALFGIMTNAKGWDYALLGGFYRMYQKVYKPTPLGLLKPSYTELKDPLALRFDYEAVLEATLLNEISRHAAEAGFPHSQ